MWFSTWVRNSQRRREHLLGGSQLARRYFVHTGALHLLFSSFRWGSLSYSGLLSGLRSRSRKESEFFGWSRIPNDTGSWIRIFLSDSYSGCPIGSFFYITLLNWEILLKWYNFFRNFNWNRHFLLCTTIYIDFNRQIPFPLSWGVGIETFGKVGVGRRETEILASRRFYLRLRNPGCYNGSRYKKGWKPLLEIIYKDFGQRVR